MISEDPLGPGPLHACMGYIYPPPLPHAHGRQQTHYSSLPAPTSSPTLPPPTSWYLDRVSLCMAHLDHPTCIPPHACPPPLHVRLLVVGEEAKGGSWCSGGSSCWASGCEDGLLLLMLLTDECSP